jgi:VanZ family protein
MNKERLIFSLLAAAMFLGVMFFSLKSDSAPFRKEIAQAVPRPAAKWVWRNYGEIRHFPSYLVFTILLQLAAKGDRRRAVYVMMAVLGLAAILELAQLWVPHRNADMRDFLWSALGALLGSLYWVNTAPRTR